MSGKLTYQSMIERVRIGLISQLWSDIQADREAIRAEVTASVTEELLKDHFKIGEETEAFYNGGWVKGVIACTDSTRKANVNVRRTPKTRPMTREEMLEDIECILEIPSEKSSTWKTETLIEVLGSFRPHLEVPV